MTYLSSNQLKQYEDQGYISPIEVLSSREALEAREEIELIEKKMPNEIDKSGRYNVHLISPKLDSIVHNPKILDAVESIIGKNILVCSTTLFIKNPNEQGFVSYHQDAKYIGLEPHNWVTAWVALTDSNENNGCMKMWPKSHLNIKDHNEKFNEGNLLTRGQTVENVPEEEVKSLELKAGQMSLHHHIVSLKALTPRKHVQAKANLLIFLELSTNSIKPLISEEKINLRPVAFSTPANKDRREMKKR